MFTGMMHWAYSKHDTSKRSRAGAPLYGTIRFSTRSRPTRGKSFLTEAILVRPFPRKTLNHFGDPLKASCSRNSRNLYTFTFDTKVFGFLEPEVKLIQCSPPKRQAMGRVPSSWSAHHGRAAEGEPVPRLLHVVAIRWWSG